MSSKPLFAAVRVQKIASMSTIRAAEAHGRRLDESSGKRVDASRTSMNLAASQYSPDDPLALESAYRSFRKATGAAEGKGAAIMAHAIAVISPEALADSGDPRDPNNPKVQALFDQAQAWARSEFGEDALVSARLDVDEKGAGVVDLYLCPTAMQSGGRGRKPKLTISVKSALERIAAENGQGRSYSALQDSWAGWASKHIDPRLQRGKPKRQTMREHVHADVLRGEAEKLERQAEKIASFVAEFARGQDVTRVVNDPENPGKLAFTRPNALSEERKKELRVQWRAVPKPLRESLRTITTERARVKEAQIKAEKVLAEAEKARKDAERLETRMRESVNEAFTACVNGELILSRKTLDAPWELKYSPDLLPQRRQELQMLGRFGALIVRILQSVFGMLDRQNVAMKDYAASLKKDDNDNYDLGWDNGPGM
jgi:hypothetical protein